jgi:nicotinamide-nucleotide amidase
VLRTWGLSESGLAEILATRIDELDRLGNPTLAFQASGIDGIKVRIVAKCNDEAAAQRILDAEEGLIRGHLGDVVFGIDDQSMEAVVLDLLCRQGLTLAVAETVTGGLLSARLSALDWAMETFRGSKVAPCSGAEPAERLAVSAAAGVRSEFGADVGLAASAPVPSEGHAPGAVFLGVDIQGNATVERVMLTPDRRCMREFSVISLLNLLRRTLST